MKVFLTVLVPLLAIAVLLGVGEYRQSLAQSCTNEANIQNGNTGDTGIVCNANDACRCGWYIDTNGFFYVQRQTGWWCSETCPGGSFAGEAPTCDDGDLCSTATAFAAWDLNCPNPGTNGACDLSCLDEVATASSEGTLYDFVCTGGACVVDPTSSQSYTFVAPCCDDCGS